MGVLLQALGVGVVDGSTTERSTLPGAMETACIGLISRKMPMT